MNQEAFHFLFLLVGPRIDSFNDNKATVKNKENKTMRHGRKRTFASSPSHSASAFICHFQGNVSSAFARGIEYKGEISICEMYPNIAKYVIERCVCSIFLSFTNAYYFFNFRAYSNMIINSYITSLFAAPKSCFCINYLTH